MRGSARSYSFLFSAVAIRSERKDGTALPSGRGALPGCRKPIRFKTPPQGEPERGYEPLWSSEWLAQIRNAFFWASMVPFSYLHNGLVFVFNIVLPHTADSRSGRRRG